MFIEDGSEQEPKHSLRGGDGGLLGWSFGASSATLTTPAAGLDVVAWTGNDWRVQYQMALRQIFTPKAGICKSGLDDDGLATVGNEAVLNLIGLHLNRDMC